MHTGTTSTSPRSLNSKDLPSITGKPAYGPISPNPKIAVPSVTIALRVLVFDFAWGIYTIFFKFYSLKYFFKMGMLYTDNFIYILPT